MPGRCQAVLDAHAGADFIEGVLATGRPVFCGEAVGELRAVVCQQFDYPDRRGQLEPAQRSTPLLSVSSARDEAMGRGTDGSFPILSLGQAVARSHTRRLAEHRWPHTDPSVHHFFGTMDQESLSCWWRSMEREGHIEYICVTIATP